MHANITGMLYVVGKQNKIVAKVQMYYSKTCVKRPLSKRLKNGFQDKLSLNAGQKYCRMLQGEHSAILLTFIKLQFVIKIFVLSIFERLLKETKSATMNILEKKIFFLNHL